MLFDYDDRDIDSIFNYAKKLESMTFREIENMFEQSIQKYYINHYDYSYSNHQTQNLIVKEPEVGYITNSKAKGQLGGFFERKYFGYKPNSEQEADFNKVGLELKQTCID